MIKFISKNNITHGVLGHLLSLEPVTQAELDLVTPEEGMIVNNSTNGRFEEYRGASWVPLSPFLEIDENDFEIVNGVLRINKTNLDVYFNLEQKQDRFNYAGGAQEFVLTGSPKLSNIMVFLNTVLLPLKDSSNVDNYSINTVTNTVTIVPTIPNPSTVVIAYFVDNVTDLIDPTGSTNGDSLVYNSVTGKFEPKKILPTATEGDLWQANALGAPVARSTTEINKSLVPFLNSPLATILPVEEIFFYDSFNRANGLLGVSDSGHTWLDLETLGPALGVIENNSARPTVANTQFNVVERTSFGIDGSFGFYTKMVSLAGFGSHVIIAMDSLNYILFQTGPTITSLFKVVNGVATNLGNTFEGNFHNRTTKTLEGWVDFSHTAGSEKMRVKIYDDVRINTVTTDLTTDIFPTVNDIKYVGFGATRASPDTRIESLVFYNIRRDL